jgi:hypothetical protein
VPSERAEHAVQIAGEGHVSGHRDHASEKRNVLLVVPDLAHSPYIGGRKLADIPARDRHLEETPHLFCIDNLPGTACRIHSVPRGCWA